MATSKYGNMTPFLRHFHVVFDVASCLLKLPNDDVGGGNEGEGNSSRVVEVMMVVQRWCCW